MADEPTGEQPVSPVKIAAAERRAMRAAAQRSDKRQTKPGTRNLGPTLEQQIAVSRRRTEAVRLAMAGLNYVEIGRALTRQNGMAEGYDGEMDDAALAAVVRSDVKRARDAARVAERETVSEHRRMMVDRHYYLLSKVWDEAAMGSHESLRDALSIMAQINRLDGLYEPTRIAVSPEDPKVREAYEAIVELARRDALGDVDLAPTDAEIGDGEQYPDDPDD